MRKDTNVDRVDVIVELSKAGQRVIVPQEGATGTLAKDDTLYIDANWRIKVYTQRLFGGGVKEMISVTYRGNGAIAKLKPNRRIEAFRTGEVSVFVHNEYVDNGQRVSAIWADLTEDRTKLYNDFGIWSFCYETPNQNWEAIAEDATKILVMSDGEVFCQYDDQSMVNPTPEDFAEIVAADDVSYEVSDATWAVVWSCACGESEHGAAVLYAKPTNFNELFASLDDYLQNIGLSRFDGLL